MAGTILLVLGIVLLVVGIVMIGLHFLLFMHSDRGQKGYQKKGSSDPPRTSEVPKDQRTKEQKRNALLYTISLIGGISCSALGVILIVAGIIMKKKSSDQMQPAF